MNIHELMMHSCDCCKNLAEDGFMALNVLLIVLNVSTAVA